MKYTVNFSCGHTETVTLFGKVSERESKISYYETKGVCSACYRAERAARIADENAKAAAIAETLVLPELSDSVKQVAWATTIRIQAHEDLMKSVRPEFKETAERFFFQFSKEHSDASWWIEDRALSGGICTNLKHEFLEFVKEQSCEAEESKSESEPVKNFVLKIEYQGIDVETLTGHHKKFVSVVQKNEQKIKEILSDFIDFDGNGEIVLTEDIKKYLVGTGWKEEHFQSQFDSEEDLECFNYRNSEHGFIIGFDISV